MASNMVLAKQNNMTFQELALLSWYDHHVLLEQTRASSRQTTPQEEGW